MPKRYFPEIEGLRAYMALWVALSHALTYAGIHEGNRLLDLVHKGSDAVDVFIILSGFVITNLILVKEERYGPYITRRFMRLFPVFAVCCTVGFVLASAYAHYFASVPWGADEATREAYMRLGEIRRHFGPHFLAHVTMLHGAVPHEILPIAERTFLGPAWSISLEWQFYLIAPLVLASFRRVWSAVAVIGAFLVLALMYERGALGTYSTYTTLAGASGYFAIGIVSRLAFDQLSKIQISPLVAVAGCAFAIFFFAKDHLPLLIWSSVYVMLLWRRQGEASTAVFEGVLGNPVVRYLGMISYSIYLSHELLLIAFGTVALMVAPAISHEMMLVVQLSAVAATIPLSAALYQFVERPGIALGRKWAEWQSQSGPPMAARAD